MTVPNIALKSLSKGLPLFKKNYIVTPIKPQEMKI